MVCTFLVNNAFFGIKTEYLLEIYIVAICGVEERNIGKVASVKNCLCAETLFLAVVIRKQITGDPWKIRYDICLNGSGPVKVRIVQ